MLNIIEGFSKHILNEFGFTKPPEYATQRLYICNECPLRKSMNEESDKNWCGACGCFIPAKVLVKNEFCPENKWQQQQ